MSRPSNRTRPAAGRVGAGDRSQERRLAGPVRADERQGLPFLQLEGHFAHGLQEPVSGVERLDREEAHDRAPLPRYASMTAVSAITASGSPSAITRPASMHTSRVTTWTST